ncbi:MAG: hypothetical protein ACXIT4_05010 [Erythrobacter sp.]
MFELINQYRPELQYVASLVLGLAMLRWGGGPERASAAVFLGCIIAPVAVSRMLGTEALMFSDYAGLYVLFDALALIGFLWIALNANRNYPLWLAGLQLVAMGAHGVRAVGEVISPLAYAIMAIGPSYGQLLVMLIGLVRHIRRQRMFGIYRDWRLGHGLPRLAAALSSR